MSDLRELYQEIILDHNKKPRNCYVMDCATRSADGHNPLCGDVVKVYLRIEDGIIEEISFQGHGCAICTASTSMMTESVKGRKVDDVKEIFHGFHDMLTGVAEEQGVGAGGRGHEEIGPGNPGRDAHQGQGCVVAVGDGELDVGDAGFGKGHGPRPRITAVAPLEGPAADRTLMPDFPGLTGTEDCRDWDPGFAIDLSRIRDRDDQEWLRDLVAALVERRGVPQASG